MNFFWQNQEWEPSRPGLSRRGFIGALIIGAMAAPLVVRPGILMPVKRLLLPYVVLKLEASYDEKKWFMVTRAVAREGALLRPADFPVRHDAPFSRVIMEREWRPGQSLLPCAPVDADRHTELWARLYTPWLDQMPDRHKPRVAYPIRGVSGAIASGILT
jgi:hypothetical protein